MAVTKITEKALVSSVEEEASVLITQQEDGVEVLRRAKLNKIVAALKSAGVNDGYVATEVLQQMLPDIVKSISPEPGKLVVTYWDGSTQDIEVASSGGLAFDAVTYDQSTGYLHIQQEGVDVVDPCYIGGGGGGGGGDSGSTITITNRNSARTLTVSESAERIEILYSATSIDTETEAPTGALTANWYINGTRVRIIPNMAQGNASFDVKRYMVSGAQNTVRLVIEDTYGGSKSMQWTVNVLAFSLSWNVEDFANHNEALNLRLIPNGQGTKTLKVTVDGVSAYEDTVETSGRAIAVTIPVQAHGAHTILAWIEATVDGSFVSTVPLKHIGLWITDGNTTPIVAFYDSELTVAQYSTVSLKYRVYNPTSESTSITLNATGDSAKVLTVGRETQTWAYKPMTSGNKTLSVTCGSVADTLALSVTATQYDIHEVTRGLILDLNPTGHNNAEEGARQFGYLDGNGTNHPLTFSSNFDWVSGGFQQDEEGVTALLIKRGCYVDFDRSFFNDNARTGGKEIKIVFKSTECRNYDAQILSGVADNIGIRLQAQSATLSSSLQSATVQYCEDKKIEMDINIESTTENKLAVIWLEGVPSRGIAYEDDGWQQASPAVVRVGSADCDVWIYRIKMYSTSLTRNEMLDNFIADCGNVTEMINRYERNDIFNSNGTINESKLSQIKPNLRVIHIKAARMTTSKSDEVICDVTLKYANGGTAKEFAATGVTMKAQGTSSLEYILAALNLDLDFKNATSWRNGNNEDITGYAMSENSIPVNYFNVKLNVASSENANNVCMADDYNYYQPYRNPARVADSRVRDTVEGCPCAVFFENTSDAAITVGARTVEAGQTILYGAGDFNNSKKNYAVFGQDTTTYPRQCCVEIGNNNNPQCRFISDDLSGETWDGESNFEFRYPKSPTAQNKADWQALLSWVVSTNTAAATGNALAESFTYTGARFKFNGSDVEPGTVYSTDTAEYRAAKFRQEFADHFSTDSMLYHYLVTERQCMVDNRAKNTFLSFEYDADAEDYRWNICKNYDDDTMAGNDNSGGLTFTYGLEDIDMVGEAHVFNAYDSVLWCNMRDYMKDELKAMFLNREAAGAWNAERIIAKWKNYQSARPEALVVEDMWGKYFTPYINNNETRYIKMMLGTKEDQFRQFQTYQERYMSAKYDGSVSTADRISLRTNAPEGEQAVPPSGDICDIVPYASTYITVRYGNAGTVKVRAVRGQSYDIEMPEGASLNDLETYIYSASNISSIGSFAALYSKFADISSARKLQQAIIGSDVAGYSNTSMTSENGGVSFGNNILIEKIDLRGLPMLAQGLDLSALKALEEIYTAGSGITGVTFARRAPLKTVVLNAVRQLVCLDLVDLETFSVSYANLQSVRIENCPIIDTKALVTAATNLTRGRLTGVNWRFDDARLLVRLAGLAGFDSAGDATDHFVLTGSAHVSLIGSHDKDIIEAAFPDLTLTWDSLLPSCTVVFKNYDGSTLDTQILDFGSSPENPISRSVSPIATPTKAMTEREVFTFNGWSWENGGTLIDDVEAVTILDSENDTVFWAHYTSETRYYDVKFYNLTTQIGSTIRAEYGEEVVYSGAIPQHPNDGEYLTYYLFKGWDTSTGYITGNTDVHALYDSCVRPVNKTLAQMSPEELHALIEEGVLSSSGTNNDMIFSGDEFELRMGHDFYFSDVDSEELVSLDSPLRFDGATVVVPEISNEEINLFDTDRSWTLVVDFSFDADCATNAVICSCADASGFVLKYDGGGQVKYGTASMVRASSTTAREIVVLRRVAGDPKLYVYSSNKNNNAISYNSIALQAAPVNDAPLSFGAQTFEDGTHDEYSKGTIHWAKIWFGNLGDNNCRVLASWPRQSFTMQAVGSDTNKYKTFKREDNGRYCNCSFMMKHLMEEGHVMNTVGTNTGGWAATPLRTWLTARIPAGLSVKWQQLLLSVEVNSNGGYQNTSLVDPPVYDKVWIPCCKEVGLQTSNATYASEGEATFTIYTGNDSRKKKMNNGAGAVSIWWLRSPYPDNSNDFWVVYTSGGGLNNYVGNSYGVAWGFCI